MFVGKGMNAEIQEQVNNVNAGLGAVMNIFLVYLINSDKTMTGVGYRRILTIISLYNIYYGIAHSVIDLGVLIDPNGFLLFSKRWSHYGFWPSYFAVMMYVNNFTQSVSLLAIHCMYRYVKITRTYQNLFAKSYGIAFIVVVHFSFAAAYTWFCGIAMKGSETRSRLSDEELRRRFNISSNGLGYFGPVYAVRTDEGLIINWDNIFGGLGCMTILGVLYGTVCITGIKLFRFLKTATMSESVRKAQFNLLTVLLAQAIAPLIFEYIPVACVCWGGFIGLPFSEVAMYIPLAIAAYPFADAVLVIVLLKNYRRRTLLILITGITFGHPKSIDWLVSKYLRSSSSVTARPSSLAGGSKYTTKPKSSERY